MRTVIIPAIIGIQVRRTIAIGETPAAPATAMMTPATGDIARSMPEANCIGVTKAAAVPPRPLATSGARAAKLEKAPTPEPVTPTEAAEPTVTPTETPEEVSPTPVETETPTPTEKAEPTKKPTSTPKPTATETPTPTEKAKK